jgi:hypothetical protein
MFRTLVSDLSQPPLSYPPEAVASAVQNTSPLQLSRWLDEVWWGGGINADPVWQNILTLVGANITPSDPSKTVIAGTRLPDTLLNTLRSGLQPDVTPPVGPQPWVNPLSGISTPVPPLQKSPIWRHLIYAYLVESTGLFEILAEVLRRYLVGETLPTPSVGTVVWTRATEELFFPRSAAVQRGRRADESATPRLRREPS